MKKKDIINSEINAGKLFKTKAQAEKYFYALPYKQQYDQKVVKAMV